MSTESDHYNDDNSGEIDVRSLSGTTKTMYESQKRFLKGYAAGGTIKAGLATAEVSRRAVELWRKHDKLGFCDRYESAHSEYTDTLEDKLNELIQGLKPGQNALVLLARLNAELPAKYRPNQVIVGNSAEKAWTGPESQDMCVDEFVAGGFIGQSCISEVTFFLGHPLLQPTVGHYAKLAHLLTSKYPLAGNMPIVPHFTLTSFA